MYASYLRQPKTVEEAQEILSERYGSEYEIYEAQCGNEHEEPMTFQEYRQNQEGNR